MGFNSRGAWARGRIIVVFACAAALAAPGSAAATFISVNDGGDADADDGVCTLREAIEAANTNTASGMMAGECPAGQASPTNDVIQFFIAGAGPHVISPGTSLPSVTSLMTIHGASGDGDDIEIDGPATAADGLTLAPGSDGSAIRSIAIYDFVDDMVAGAPEGDGIRIESANTLVDGSRIGTDFADTAGIGNEGDGIDVVGDGFSGGDGTLIEGNTVSGNDGSGVVVSDAEDNIIRGNRIGVTSMLDAALPNDLTGVALQPGTADNVIGGTAAGQGNLISGNGDEGIIVQGGDDNQVLGNLIGTNTAGTAAVPNGGSGVVVFDATDTQVGGASASARNLISGNMTDGIVIFGPSASGNRLEGNYIGTNAAGTADLGNLSSGVSLSSSATGNVVGSAGAGNVISANDGAGVVVASAGTSQNVIRSNRIGVAATTDAALGNELGVFVGAGASDNVVGGTGSGEGNVIAKSSDAANGDGVRVAGATSLDNSILGNSIDSNLRLGIDLFAPGDLPSGVTLNDAGDGDAGVNDLQNYPQLNAAVTGSSTHVSGTLDSAANTTHRLEFFSNLAADPSGFGEGRRFLGAANVTTNAGGDASFAVTVPGTAGAGQSVTATATELGPGGNPGSTSEFSEAIVEGPCDIEGTGGTNTLTGTGAAEIICGFAANDLLRGAGGDDVLLGGSGDDSLDGGAGNDRLDGEGGNDTASFAGAGAPVVASLSTRTAQGQGNDTLVSIAALVGSPLSDQLTGDSEPNALDGGAGNDRLVALGGADRALGRGGRDRLVGGIGPDLLSGGPAGDRLLGGVGADRMFGGGGSDRLRGARGRDLLTGGPGRRDRCNGGGGKDRRRHRGCERVTRIP